MTELIELIVGDAQTFTPQALVGLIVFTCYLEAICSLLGAVVSGVRRK